MLNVSRNLIVTHSCLSDLKEPCDENNYKKLDGKGRNVNKGMPDDIQRQVHGESFFEISLKMSLVINLFLGWCDGDINHPFKPDNETGCEKLFSYSLAFPPKK